MLPRLLVVLAMVTLALAGCVAEPDEGADASYRISGTLAEDFDEADRQDLEREANERGAGVAIMESFPMQYQVSPLARADCDAFQLVLAEKDYVADVGPCQAIGA